MMFFLLRNINCCCNSRIMDKDLRKDLWLFWLKEAYHRDFAGKVILIFADGGLRDATPKPENKRKVPRELLPSKDYTGTIILDCAVFSGALVETVK
jgi:hypothetical protein